MGTDGFWRHSTASVVVGPQPTAQTLARKAINAKKMAEDGVGPAIAAILSG